MSTRQRFAGPSALAAAIALTAGSAIPAFAAEDAEMLVEEVVVTGSRIPRAGFDTMLPATVLGEEFLEARGFTNVADALNQVPSFGTPGSSTEGDQSSFSVGQNFVNFFGLGSQRTLTLVNGRRFVSSNAPTVFSNANPGLQVDLNVIPSSMIERVETVAVGGAPIYGADAIAGTVNVILKDDFEGFEIGGSWGNAMEDNDLEERNFEFVYGTNFADGRGNIVVGFEFNDREGLIEADRDHLDEGWQFREPPAGSNSPFTRVLVPNAHANIVASGGAITPAGTPLLPNFGLGSVGTDANGDPLFLSFQPDGSLGPYNVGSPTGNPVWSVDGEGIFLPDLTSLFTPVDRTLVSSFASYDLTENVEFFGEFYYANNNAKELINQPAYQSAFFGDESFALTFDADHPLLTQSARDTLAANGLTSFDIQRASVDLGDRRINSELDLWRVVAGFRGDFEIAERTVNWDASWTKGKSDSNTSQNEIVSSFFFQALDVVDTADGPACRVVADPSSRPADPAAPFGANLPAASQGFDSCVPLDIFGEGRASQEAIDYITAAATSNTEIVQEIFSLNANIDLFDLPAGSFYVAGGFEHREESARFDVGGLTELGLGRSVGVNGTTGGYETDEYYGEFFAPVVSDSMDIPLVDNFSIEGAWRTVDNDIAGKDDIWTIGGRWTIVPDVEFRANKTRSVRAPAITELFLPLSGTFSFADDPCDQRFVDGGPNPETRRANCIADGITDPDNFASSVANASVQGFTGGNLDLENEVADAYTYGVILRPRWVEDLTIAIDYVDIEIEDAIEDFTLTQIMESCYDASSFPNEFCDQFTRLPSGQLPATNAFTSGFVNAGVRTLQAWTVDMEWFSDLKSWPGLNRFDNPGSLGVAANMFFPQEAETLIQGAIDDSLGEPDTAEEQIQLNLTYVWNDLRVLWQTRYISEATIDNDDGPDARDVSELDEVFLFNAGVQYTFNENVRVQLNIDNVFDKQPERASIASGWDNVYDNTGRYIRAGVKINL
jgi:outer membrane receptor protein involved in Fe transport